ncbi:MAG TPA: hypothetical protein ENJ44_02870, partial [Oceanospirillales bacterium]|nr:hypothetical protein [Oceanospirillales bacterium]
MVAKFKYLFLLFLSTNVLAHPKIEARIAQITQAIKQTPNNSHLYLQRAELYREHREFGMAEKDYTQAIAKGEDKNSVAYFQAMLLRDQGKLIAARKLFKQVANNVKDESLQLLALVNLAEIYKLDKKWLLAAQN